MFYLIRNASVKYLFYCALEIVITGYRFHAYSSQVWARLTLGAGSLIRVSHKVGQKANSLKHHLEPPSVAGRGIPSRGRS